MTKIMTTRQKSMENESNRFNNEFMLRKSSELISDWVLLFIQFIAPVQYQNKSIRLIYKNLLAFQSNTYFCQFFGHVWTSFPTFFQNLNKHPKVYYPRSRFVPVCFWILVLALHVLGYRAYFGLDCIQYYRMAKSFCAANHRLSMNNGNY